jgi:3-oxoacyl-[acyl-carrier-protein] synthase-3
VRDAIITGWGKCLPPAVLSNSDLETVTDTSDEWITTRTGIKERRISHVETSDLSAVAAQRAMASAGVTAEDLDLILVATCSPDRLIPSAATMVQAKIGASNAAGMDLNAACSGFVFALSTADQMIKTGAMDTVLIVGAEKMSYWLDFSNRATSVLFGDGAGAVVVQAAEEGTDGGLLAFELGSDGTAGGLLCVPASGTEGRADRSELPTIEMEGREVFKRAVTSMADASMRVLAAAGLEMSDVDLLIPHQANVRIVDAMARRLNLAPEKIFVNIASYGNTSAATIPIAIAEAIEDGRIEPGATVVFAAFGGGFTWAAAVYRWGPRIEPLGISDAELPPNDKTALELLAGNIALHGTGV